MADVARVAGVSAQTVSRVANGSNAVREETRDRVLAAMHSLDYRPSFAARTLKAGRYHCLGIAMSGNIAATGRQYQLGGIATAASEASYAVTFVHLADSEATFGNAARRMLELPVDGYVISLSTIPEDFEEFAPPEGIPCSVITPRPHPRCRTVEIDNRRCAEELVERLVGTGRREIRLVAGPATSLHSQERVVGWQAAMVSRGLEAREPLRGDWTAKSGYAAGRVLAGDATCDAVIACNDAMAMGVIAALRDAGREVPGDVAVAGVDDSLRDSVPGLDLTTYRFDYATVSRIAFEEARGEGQSLPRHQLVPGRLVARQTA